MSAKGAGGLVSGPPFFNDTASFATISAGAAMLVQHGGVFENSASAASFIALQIGGQLFGAVYLASQVEAHLSNAQGFGESTSTKPVQSTKPVVFEHKGVRFGLMSLYDLRFTELAGSLADAGAQVLLVCSSCVPGELKTEQWLVLIAARASKFSVYVAGVSVAAGVRGPECAGESDVGLLSRTLGWSLGLGR